MNEDYLYKARRKDNGEWIKGSYYIKNGEKGKTFLRVLKDDDYEIYEVFEEPMLNSLDRQDKNGREIFEDDFVKVRIKDKTGRIYKYTVLMEYDSEYDDYPFHLLPKPGDEIDWIDFKNYKAVDLEVIGNKFDNPELLKEVGRMTDKEVGIELIRRLLSVDDNICSCCMFDPKGDICSNERDRDLEICYEGIKKFMEKEPYVINVTED